jgi:hypothetical protein
MGARTKLNELHAVVAVGIATALAMATGSWMVFGIGLIALLAIKVHSGSIRPCRIHGR